MTPRKHARHHRQSTTSGNQTQALKAGDTIIAAPYGLISASASTKAKESRPSDTAPARNPDDHSDHSKLVGTEMIAETIICKTTTARLSVPNDVSPAPPKAVPRIRWGRAHRDMERYHPDVDSERIAIATNGGVSRDDVYELETPVTQDGVDTPKSPESANSKPKTDQMNKQEERLPRTDSVQDDMLRKDLDVKQKSPIIIDLTGDIDHEIPKIVDLTGYPSPLLSYRKTSITKSSSNSIVAPAQIPNRASQLTVASLLCRSTSINNYDDSMTGLNYLSDIGQSALSPSTGERHSTTGIIQPNITPGSGVSQHMSRPIMPTSRFIAVVTNPSEDPGNSSDGPSISQHSFFRDSEKGPVTIDHEGYEYLPSPTSTLSHHDGSQPQGARPSNGAPSVASPRPRLLEVRDWDRCLPPIEISQYSHSPSLHGSIAILDTGPISSYMPAIIDKSKYPGLPQSQMLGVISPQSSNGIDPVPAGSDGLEQHQQHPAQHSASQGQIREPTARPQQSVPTFLRILHPLDEFEKLPDASMNARPMPEQQPYRVQSVPSQRRQALHSAQIIAAGVEANRQLEEAQIQHAVHQPTQPLNKFQQSWSAISPRPQYQQLPANQNAPQWRESASKSGHFGQFNSINDQQKDTAYRQKESWAVPTTQFPHTSIYRATKTPPTSPYETQHLRSIIGSHPFCSSA